ncbi:MAG TPA: SRPBCC family protein [Actinomycetota bacterium]|nr:SRPBCC family protein [Actinomycetota bacterium]
MDEASRDQVQAGHVNQAVVVGAPATRVYEYWRDFEHFPQFMEDVESVTRNPDGSWHWVVGGPLGKRVGWDAVVTEDVPGEVIMWRSVGDSDVQQAGTVRFTDTGGGTELHANIAYTPPAGKVGKLVADVVKDPDKQVARSLERFRALVETW